MVLGEIFVTKPNSTAFCASKRTVQWSCPSGAGLQATAIRWAVCKPESALRRCCCTLSCKTASSPPCAKRRRTFVTVASHTSKAAASSAVLHPSADLRRMRARVRVRALALPRCTKVSRVLVLHRPKSRPAVVAWSSSVLAQYTTSLKAKRTGY